MVMKFYDKDKNNNTIQSLAYALSKRDNTPINVGGINAPIKQQKDDDILGGASGLLTGGAKLFGSLKDGGLFGGSGSNDLPLTSGGFFGSGSSGSMTMDNILGNGGSGSMTFDNITSSGGGGFGGTPLGVIGGIGKQGYNLFSGKGDGDYSDVEQSTIYPLQGASMGAQFGPWGALGGALYGLGYSFKDDLGLKDNNFLTDIIFPIGMGDEHQGLLGIFN